MMLTCLQNCLPIFTQQSVYALIWNNNFGKCHRYVIRHRNELFLVCLCVFFLFDPILTPLHTQTHTYTYDYGNAIIVKYLNYINIIYELVQQGVFTGMQRASKQPSNKQRTTEKKRTQYLYIYIGKLLRLSHAAHIH